MNSFKRLLENIEPISYEVRIAPNYSDWSFKGYEKIRFNLKESTKELRLHGIGLEISSCILDGDVKCAAYHTDDKNENFVFTFLYEIDKGEHGLTIEFIGQIREDLNGFYRSSFLHDGKNQTILTTQFEPVSARKAFFCIDEPAAKAAFLITLDIPHDLIAISNTKVLSETSIDSKVKRIIFEQTPKMSPYLVVFIIGNFEHKSLSNEDGVEIGVYTPPGKIQQADFALNTAARILHFYAEYFGIAYPLSKLDMIAIPDFAAGAMENWGAVTYREVTLLIDEVNSALTNKQYVAMVVAHELAHQWFGNLVTMHWWTDLWLNEGFASWIEYLAVDHLYPDWKMWTQFVSDDYLAARELDSLKNTHPIEVEIFHPSEIEEIFDEISYQKGASIIRMLHAYMGEDAFKTGLHNYLETRKYSNAVTADLWTFLEDSSALPVRKIMHAWTSLPGFPLITLAENGTLSQQRFSLNQQEAQSSQPIWPVPFEMVGEGKTLPSKIFETPIMKTTIKAGNWFKANPNQTGFYIFNYSTNQLKVLKEQLQNPKITEIDRLGLVSDVTALASSGQLSGSQILELAEQLRAEHSYAVWTALIGGVGELMTIANDELHKELEKFCRWLVGPKFLSLGWEPKKAESHFDSLLRPSLLGIGGRSGDIGIINEARRRFSQHLLGDYIPPDLRSPIYRIIAKFGSEPEYQSLLSLYNGEQLQEESRRLLAALSGFQKKTLVQETLALSLSDKVRPQDSISVLAYSLINRAGRDLTWSFIQKNWGVLEQRYGQGGHLLSRIPQSLGVYQNREKALEIEEFFSGKKNIGIDRTIRQVVERIRHQAAWFERDGTELFAYLSKKY
ncbi:MAG: M1 family metallopeptidase [Candidatus Saccharimonadia bacterium]